MARPLRVEFPGAWYHVMNRGAGHRTIFPDDWLRRSFLRLLCDVHDRYAVCCHAYCLMGNHYHLLVQTMKANLGHAMRHLDGVYAQRHNHRLKTDGPLFRGRYKAQLIERETYLLCLSRYVHRNPLAAGLCKRIVDYPWSSYPCYAGLRAVPSWLYLHETIGPFGCAKAYCKFVEGADNDQDRELVQSLAADPIPPVLGSKDFVDTIRQRYCGEPDYEIPQAKAGAVVPTADEIIDVVSEQMSVGRKDLIMPGSQRARTVRAMAMLLCRQCSGARLREIADAFGVKRYTTVSSAIRRLRDRVKRDAQLARELKHLRQQVREMHDSSN